MTGAIVLIVAILVLTITVTARKIASVAMAADRSLETTHARTAVLWMIATTNRVTRDIFESAVIARRGLGGEGTHDALLRAGAKTPEEIVGRGVKTSQDAVQDSLPTGPQTDPEHGSA